jgi:hypothetical protein
MQLCDVNTIVVDRQAHQRHISHQHNTIPLTCAYTARNLSTPPQNPSPKPHNQHDHVVKHKVWIKREREVDSGLGGASQLPQEDQNCKEQGGAGLPSKRNSFARRPS